jgi:membrane-anchored protein YejM (alkaline phosphatase superfamily)
MTIHLLDQLTEAKIDAPSPNYVLIQPITINRDMRSSIFQHPNSTIRFEHITLGKKTRLSFGSGVKEVVWEKIKSAVEFKIEIIDKRGRGFKVFEATLDVRNRPGDRLWHQIDLDLKKFDTQTITLVFNTQVAAGGDGSYAWVGWSDPCLKTDRGKHAPAVCKQPPHNILLLVADALRYDYLGCYGNAFVKTPNIDELARDGCLMRHARAQTPTTLGSLTSIMTGLHATNHGVLKEWGQCQGDTFNIARMLAAAGYTTVAALSEREYGDGAGGLLDWFEHNIPTLGTPMQAGDVTTRRFLNWLDKQDSSIPFFGWLHYFDAHPPAMAPEPFNQLYYQGDPGDTMRSYNADLLTHIHGIEAVLEIETQLPLIKQGTFDQCLLIRLRDTAEVMLGKSENKPDLADHLINLGADARQGLSVTEFGRWLEGQVRRLERNEVSGELIDWLVSVLPLLKEIEREITDWLRGAVDFRYAVAQYMSEITHLDQHIGILVKALKQRNLYENTTIIFVAPHGELLGESGLCFHHMALREEVLRVPLLFKGAQQLQTRKGCIIDGVFDHIDILPTLAALLQINLALKCDGVSRAKNLLTGASISDHDSFSVDYHGAMVSLTRPPYTFLKALTSVRSSNRWHWQAGETGLFRLSLPMTYHSDLRAEQKALAGEMENRLADWLSKVKPFQGVAPN